MIEEFEINFLPNVRGKTFTRKKYNREQLTEFFSTPSILSNKNTKCFLFANIHDAYSKGGKFHRASKAEYVRGFSAIIFDLDYISSIEEVCKPFRENNIEHWYYTTYNHKNDVTISRSKKLLSLKKKEDILAFAEKYYSQLVLKKDNPYTLEDDCVKFHHEPVNKYRLIIPLSKEFTDLTNWENFLKIIDFEFNVGFDASCVDLNRLYFAPTVSKDREGTFESGYFEGDPLNLDKYVDRDGVLYRSVPEHKKANQPTYKLNERAKDVYSSPDVSVIPGRKHVIYTDKDGETLSLTTFANATSASFSIVDFFEKNLSDTILQERSNGGLYVVCPNIDNHSSTGVTDTYIDDEESHFTFHCSHNSCSDYSTLDLFKQTLEQYQIPVSAFSNLLRESDYSSVSSSITEENITSKLSTELLQEIGLLLDNEPSVESMIRIIKENNMNFREAVESIAVSKLTQINVYKVVNEIHKSFDVETEEFIEEIRSVRGYNSKGLEEAIIALLDSEVNNLVMEDKVMDLAHYYLIDPKTVRYKVDSIFFAQFPHELRKYIEIFDKDIAINISGGASKYLKLSDESFSTGNVLYFLKNFKQFKSVNVFPNLLSEDGLKKIIGTHKIKTVSGSQNKVTTIDPFSVWKSTNTRKILFTDITFNPNIDEMFVNFNGSKTNAYKYNLWKGFLSPIKPIRGDWSVIRDHLFYGACQGNEESFNWLMTWFASIFQQPSEKPPAAVIFSGGYGTGKSIIADQYLSRLLFPYHYYTKNIDDILNPKAGDIQLAGKLLCNLDEATFSGDASQMRKLLSFIQSDTTSVRSLFVNKFSIPNLTRILLTTNEIENAVMLKKNDRRYSIFKTSYEWESKYRQDENYFRPLVLGVHDPKLLGAFLYALLNWDPEEHNLSWFSLHTPVVTEERIQQLVNSYEPQTKLIYELIKTGVLDLESGDVITLKMDEPFDLINNKTQLIKELKIRLGYRKSFLHESHDMFTKELFDDFVEEKCAYTGMPLAPRAHIAQWLYDKQYMSKRDYDYCMKVGDSLADLKREESGESEVAISF